MGNKVVIIRGLPGSGKSTLAKRIEYDNRYSSEPYKIIEADKFFEDKYGTYQYKRYLQKDAHEWAKLEAKRLYNSGHNIIIANTFTQKWEIDTYIKAIGCDDFKVSIYKCTGEYKNIHGVPQEVIDKMKNRWDDIKGEEIWSN